MADNHRPELGAVQQTLFIPLAARAAQTRKKRPLLRDPMAAELLAAIDFDRAKYGQDTGGGVVVLRTVIFDWWVREFLAEHPAGTVVELGAGLNTRFERVDNGQVHWIDLDLPDTIQLRAKFFNQTPRRQLIAGSVLDDDWRQAVSQQDGPYFFVTDGVLVYLPEDQVLAALARHAEQFPGALLALDTYSRQARQAQHRMAARKGIARWDWACDHPRDLERHGWQVLESVRITRPPARLRAQLPARYRCLLPLADPFFGRALRLTLLRANPR
jgi:O-methyltransferase involved in polyketide biosynthesis